MAASKLKRKFPIFGLRKVVKNTGKFIENTNSDDWIMALHTKYRCRKTGYVMEFNDIESLRKFDFADEYSCLNLTLREKHYLRRRILKKIEEKLNLKIVEITLKGAKSD